MQHFILRCKHCQKEYTYCTYGNGPEYGTEEGCSMDYCAECQKAINNGLENIPVKFEERLMEIEEPMLFDLFEKIKKESLEKQKDTPFPNRIPIPNDMLYDYIETYIHKNKKYFVKWNEDEPDNKHIFICMEYDKINENFTGKPWRYSGEDSYTYCYNKLFKTFNNLDIIAASPMEQPNGNLFYVNYNWDIISPKTEEKQPEHILNVFEREETGLQLKTTLQYGWYETTVMVDKNVNISNLLDFVDYKCTYEQYADEKIAKLTKIECV